MFNRKSGPPGALLTAAAAVIAVGPTAGTASAQPLASGSGQATGPCAARALRASVRSGIPGDPAGEQGQIVLNVVLSNAGTAVCSLRGWPALTVLRSGGRAVIAKVTDVAFNNLGPVPDRRVTLRPGGNAVLTVTGPGGARGCATAWSVALNLAGHRVVAGQPAGLSGVCLGGQLSVAPFYPMTSLQAAVRALGVSADPSPFRTTTAPEPAACMAAALAVRESAAVSRTAGGSIITLGLGTTGRACALASGGWPTVRLHLSGGASPVAKRFEYAPALRSMTAALTTYRHAGAEPTVLTLRPGKWTPIVLLAPATASRACRAAASVTVYPSEIALGAGRTITLAHPVAACGALRTLPYLPAGSASRTRSLAGRALKPADASAATGITPAGDSPSGFWYGTDGPATMACGSAPYLEASSSSANPCASTDGQYGGYMGEIGKWDVWRGCDSNGLAWNQTDYNDANTDYDNYVDGVGASGYWMMAGPGRDPRYSGTTSEATTWGRDQAEEAVTKSGSDELDFIFMDVEQYTHDNELDNGWNTVWTKVCGGTGTPHIAPSVDLATVNGFADYVNNDTSITAYAGVYSAGGDGAYEWSGIFTGEDTSLPEWTFEGGVSSISAFPTGWSVDGISSSFFGNGPPDCEMAWQWTGGGGHTNPAGLRIDQFDANNYYGNCGI